MPLRSVALSELEIRDERTFLHVPLYERLKQRLIADDYRFAVAGEADAPEDWARVLFLNLTFWQGREANDVLSDPSIDADVVAHVGWHHVIRRAVAEGDRPPSADALFFGEAVASAFDLYLLGKVFGRTRKSTFLESAIPAMFSVALNAGMSEEDFGALLEQVAADPDRAFESVRALLFDVTTGLVGCTGVGEAAEVLERFRDHPFSVLLHHFELAVWVLYARAYAGEIGPDPKIRELDRRMREAPVSVDWLWERCAS
jgi:hypothetical protein